MTVRPLPVLVQVHGPLSTVKVWGEGPGEGGSQPGRHGPGLLLTAGTGVLGGPCLVPGTDVFTLSEGLPGPWAAGSLSGPQGGECDLVSPLTGPRLPLLQRSLQRGALPTHPGPGPSEKRASFSFAERCVCVTHRSQDNFNSEAGPKNATGFLFSLAGSAGSGAMQKPPPTQVGWLNGGLVRGPAGRELASGRPTTSPARRAQLEAPASARQLLSECECSHGRSPHPGPAAAGAAAGRHCNLDRGTGERGTRGA